MNSRGAERRPSLLGSTEATTRAAPGARRLLQILAAGFVAFMAIAMAEEWRIFAAAWLGAAALPRPALLPEDERDVVRTVREYLALSTHLYASGGDRRFAERMPVTQALLDETLADVVYLKHNRRIQEPTLVKVEVRGADLLAPGRAEVRTTEYWTVRILDAVDRKPLDPTAVQVVRARYLVRLVGSLWRVEAWDLDDRPPESS